MPVSSMSTEMAMCGALSFCEKCVEETLRIRRIVVNDAREVSLVLRVVVIESLLDELRVRVVTGEENRLG